MACARWLEAGYSANRVDIFKTALAKAVQSESQRCLGKAGRFKPFDGANHISMAFAKVLCDLKTGGNDGSVIHGKLRMSGDGGRTNQCCCQP